jgi:hypothetical protein
MTMIRKELSIALFAIMDVIFMKESFILPASHQPVNEDNIYNIAMCTLLIEK